MKTLLIGILVIFGISNVPGEDTADPFAYVPAKKVDRSNDKGSFEFLSDNLLKALEERRLDNRAPEFHIRITIDRSFHSPLVLIWAMEKQVNWIRVKRARMKIGANGDRVYDGLEINKRVELSAERNANLQTLLENANIDGLPQECWQGEDILDGSTWIFEIYTVDGWCLLNRRSPIGPRVALQRSKISKERIGQEFSLTAFALMLWAYSGIEDAELY